MKKIFGIFVFILIFFVSYSFAQNYADINIEIFNDGSVSIDGPSNYADFYNVTHTQKYTSKQGDYWVFNLSTKEVFNDYVFELQLPIAAQINYIKAPAGFRIEGTENQLKIVGFGEDEPINLMVQYKTDSNSTYINKDFIILLLSGALVFMIVFVIVLLIKINDLKKRKDMKKEKSKKGFEKENDIDIQLFTPRQQEIIEILKKKKRLTQKELEGLMNIPKSSVSRNVRTLEIKEVIKKERVGQTNYISLKV